MAPMGKGQPFSISALLGGLVSNCGLIPIGQNIPPHPESITGKQRGRMIDICTLRKSQSGWKNEKNKQQLVQLMVIYHLRKERISLS